MKRAKLHKKWRRERKKARKKLQFEYLDHTKIPGTNQLVGFIGALPWPIGTVWYCFSGLKQIEVVHSYVVPWARRCGVRTALHREMQRGYPGYAIAAAEANRRSKPWLKKQGFKLKRRGWVLRSRE